MADDTNNENGLPPKLDLRKKVLTPPNAKPDEPASGADAAATPASPAVPAPAQGSTGEGNEPAPETMRIKIPATPEPQAATPSTPPTLKKPEDASQDTGKPEPPSTQPAPATDSKPAVGSAPASGSAPAAAGPRPLTRPTMGPKTIKLKKPVPLGIKRDTPDPTAPTGSKRATSKISLPASPEAQQAATKTAPQPIQIAKTTPAPAADTTEGASESEKRDTPAPATPPQSAPDPKRQTSRISLDSAYGSESKSAPKTIKLKRPTSNTAKVQGMGSPDAADAKHKTSGVELPSDSASDDDAPETQKKTIKVKRPSVRPSLHKSGSGGTGKGTTGGGGGTSPMFAPPQKAAAPVDSAHWFFILTGCAATIITGVLIYVQSAQAFGPNISLTELSYGAPEAELPWPGRITR